MPVSNRHRYELMHNGSTAQKGPSRSSVEAVRPAITKAKWRAFVRGEAGSIVGPQRICEDRGGSSQSVGGRADSFRTSSPPFIVPLRRQPSLR
jgi:hypothetical protein